MKREEKLKKIQEFKDAIIESLASESFHNLLVLLGESTESLVRSAVVDAMELYYPEEYKDYIGGIDKCIEEDTKKSKIWKNY